MSLLAMIYVLPLTFLLLDNIAPITKLSRSYQKALILRFLAERVENPFGLKFQPGDGTHAM